MAFFPHKKNQRKYALMVEPGRCQGNSSFPFQDLEKNSCALVHLSSTMLKRGWTGSKRLGNGPRTALGNGRPPASFTQLYWHIDRPLRQ